MRTSGMSILGDPRTRNVAALDAGPGSHRPAADTDGFWKRAVETSLAPLLVVDRNRKCVVASDAMLAQSGFGRPALIGRPVDELIVEADGTTLAERLDRCEVLAGQRAAAGGSASDAAATEFGVTLRSVDGTTTQTRAILRFDRLGEEPLFVLSMRPFSDETAIAGMFRRRVELELLLDSVQHSFTSAGPDEVHTMIVLALKEVAEYLGADRGYILRFDHEAKTESMVHEWAAPGIASERDTYRDVAWDLAPAAMQRNNKNWISAVLDVAELTGEWETDRLLYEESGICSILEFPIVIAGQAMGTMGFDWMTSMADWTEDDLTVIGMFASTFSHVLGRDAAETELAHRMNHDDLTGLPNRLGLIAQLTPILEGLRNTDRRVVGALMVDLDHFKVVNDLLGEAVGDELLRLVADRIRTLVRPTDLVARIGADEFVVVLLDAASDSVVDHMAERVRGALAEPFDLAGRLHILTASCGIATAHGPGTTAHELVRRAGAAMFRAKVLGRSRQARFDLALEEELSTHLELDQRLRQALELGEFEVHYQPEVDRRPGRVRGAEALLRWRSDGVLREAFRFMDVVEETGIIVPVGRWVLQEAVRQAAKWIATTGDAEFTIRVNLSPRQFEDTGLLDTVRELLERYELAPERLCLEITETAVMVDAERALTLLGELDELGVNLAIDDFGTGYSSLSYLKRFPIDILKIDKSFVEGLPADAEDFAIVGVIIKLAESLGMEVTAEGIEKPEHAAALLELGCERGQGWLYAKALPPEEFTAMLHSALPAS